ncbi:MAG: putative Histidine kinase [Acidimicrobiales bacterium]|nr:putative Histidine kinase [Acidimicrobiales bacterium]
MRRLLTVRNRTTAVAAIVVAVALCFGAVRLVGLVRDRLIEGQRTAAALRAQDVAALAESGQLPDNLSFPGEDAGLTQVIDNSGTVVAATDNLEGEPPISDLRPDGDGPESEIVNDTPIGDGGRFVVVATTVDTDDGTRTILSSASLEETDDTVRAMSVALALGIPLLVALVAIVTRALVGRALLPVERMSREASEITEQHLDRRLVEPGTGDEVHRLAGTLNEMLGRLDAANARQQRFVTDASHELRSPLASARAALEVAVAHPDKIDAQHAMASALVDQARLELLVDDLLLLAKVTGKDVRPAERVDLGEIITDEVAAADDPRVTVTWDDDPPVVAADERTLARVVRNLLDNARRHAHDEIRISSSSTGRTVHLEVEDDGEGVPEADRERIFDRFTRLDEARAQEAGGSGLGLSIVRAAVEALGGTVSVDDSALGGVRFTVTIPTAETVTPREGR